MLDKLPTWVLRLVKSVYLVMLSVKGTSMYGAIAT